MNYYVSSALSWKDVSKILAEVITDSLGEKMCCNSTWQDNSYWYTRICERSLRKNEVEVLCKTAGVPFTDKYAIFPDDEEYTHDISMDLSLALLKKKLDIVFRKYYYDPDGLLFVDIQAKK